MIFIIDSDRIMSDCIARACVGYEINQFYDVYAVIKSIDDGIVPSLIFLDVMLTGPDGFSLLNELVSYDDTAKIPVVIVSMLKFKKEDLKSYGVVGVLNKETMLPIEMRAYAEKYDKMDKCSSKSEMDKCLFLDGGKDGEKSE